MATARKDGYSAGQKAALKNSPSSTVTPPSSSSIADVLQTKVKQIMNELFRSLSGKFQKDKQYSTEDIKSLFSATIKVSI